MTARPHILVVSQNPRWANALLSWLGAAGYELALVATFAAAKKHLSAQPDLVIADVKLGAYNGLHLAVRARGAGIPTIVIGPNDPVLRRDATQLGTHYLDVESDRDGLLTSVESVLGGGAEAAPGDPRRGLLGPAASLPTPSSVEWQLLLGDPAPAKSSRPSKRVVLH